MAGSGGGVYNTGFMWVDTSEFYENIAGNRWRGLPAMVVMVEVLIILVGWKLATARSGTMQPVLVPVLIFKK